MFLIKEAELDIPSRLTAIQILDARILTYWFNLPVDLRLDDVNDVGLGHIATATGADVDDESSISRLISQIVSDEHPRHSYNPVVVDPVPFNSLTDLYDMDLSDLIDEWIEQLMHQIPS